jgi:adenosylmethionine-8-amino-7-oxononanoate aminotransferase
VLMNEKVVAAFMNGNRSFINGRKKYCLLFGFIAETQIAGHTYQQHVMGCRVGLEVLKVYEEEDLVMNCRKQGALLERLLREKLGEHTNVGDIR